MKKLILTTAALALSASFAMAQDMVRMGTEGAYPPYNFINDAGEIDGFEREVGDELCKRAELTCEWVKNDWDSIIPNLVSGNYDTIVAGMSITDERDKVIDFTQDYYPPTASAYVAASDAVDVIAARSLPPRPPQFRRAILPKAVRLWSSSPHPRKPLQQCATARLTQSSRITTIWFRWSRRAAES